MPSGNNNITCTKLSIRAGGWGSPPVTLMGNIWNQKNFIIVQFPAYMLQVEIKFRAQLFEGRLVLNPGLNLTRVSFRCVQKHLPG